MHVNESFAAAAVADQEPALPAATRAGRAAMLCAGPKGDWGAATMHRTPIQTNHILEGVRYEIRGELAHRAMEL
jgi:hypothetical protein